MEASPEPVDLGIGGLSLATKIGAGGFATVFAAEWNGQQVAVKLLKASADSPLSRRSFAREQAALEALGTHEDIVPILGSGLTDRGEAYFLMPLFSGSLQNAIREHGPMAPESAVTLMVRVARAVQAAHDQSVLHRDLKPDNVLLRTDGSPVVADFGIAKFVEVTASTSHLAATPAYCAPEVLRGEPASVASDVYGLAATTHALLAGASPFSSGPDAGVASVLLRAIEEPAPRLAADGIPDSLSAMLQRALSKDPAQRPKSAAAFAEELERSMDRTVDKRPTLVIDGPSAPEVRPEAEHSGKPARRLWAGASAILISALLLGMLGWAAVRDRSPADATAPTGEEQTLAGSEGARDSADSSDTASNSDPASNSDSAGSSDTAGSSDSAGNAVPASNSDSTGSASSSDTAGTARSIQPTEPAPPPTEPAANAADDGDATARTLNAIPATTETPTPAAATTLDTVPGPAPTVGTPHRDPNYVLALSDSGLVDTVVADGFDSSVKFGRPINAAIDRLSGYLFSDPQYSSGVTGAPQWYWGDLSIASSDGETFDSWSSTSTEPPLAIEGLSGVNPDLTLDTEPAGLRSSWPGINQSGEVGITAWIGSGLYVQWVHDQADFNDPSFYPPDLASSGERRFVSVGANQNGVMVGTGAVTVTTNDVNVRLVPSLNAPVIDQASPGNLFEATTSIQEADGLVWTFVVPFDENRWSGWIASDLLVAPQ